MGEIKGGYWVLPKASRSAGCRFPSGDGDASTSEVLAYPGVSASWVTAADESPALPMRVMRLRKGDVSMSLFCMITVVQIPCDITLQNLRVECFYPADRATEEAAHRFATAAPAVA